MHSQITPIIITYNEAENIERSLSRLSWARDVVLVDSFSRDDTLKIANQFGNVRIYQREFDDFARQWRFALEDTGISTEWVLALDADYILTDGLIDEFEALTPTGATTAYRATFRYCIHGRPVFGSLYQPVTVLFRLDKGHFIQQGHAYRLHVDGETLPLHHPIFHDDRKPLARWLATQTEYARQEARYIVTTEWGKLRLSGKIRALRFPAPFLAFFVSLFWKGAVLSGPRGLLYAFQRMLSEVMIVIALLDSRNFEQNQKGP
jgi:glycosyltransferase involved in cell wall biosynthesis